MKTQNDLKWKVESLRNSNKHLFNFYTVLGGEQLLQI